MEYQKPAQVLGLLAPKGYYRTPKHCERRGDCRLEYGLKDGGCDSAIRFAPLALATDGRCNPTALAHIANWVRLLGRKKVILVFESQICGGLVAAYFQAAVCSRVWIKRLPKEAYGNSVGLTLSKIGICCSWLTPCWQRRRC